VAATPRKSLQRLEAADKKLLEVRRHLIRCGPLDAQVIPLLRQIAEVLQAVRSDGEFISGSEEAQRLLKEIQTSTEKARLLLQSAAELTCHSVLTKPSIAGSYTPDGEFPCLEFSGRMIVHA
jgi:hypothetical protein